MTRIRTGILILLAALAARAAAAEPATLALGAPTRLELYLDGARLVHALALPAGRTRIPLPPAAGALVQVDGCDSWVLEQRIASATQPEVPPALAGLLARQGDLERRGRVLAGTGEAAARMAGELAQRLGQRAVQPGDEAQAWQGALDGVIAMREAQARERLALDADWRALKQEAESEAAPGLTFAVVMGLDSGRQPDPAEPALAAARLWRAAVERSDLTRTLVVERAAAGAVTVVTERTDLRWAPRARLLAAKGAAVLVRQAAVQVPAGLALPALPTRLVGGPRQQALEGAPLVPRQVVADSAPVAERRSVTTTARPAGWASGEAVATSREQTWELAALAIAAPAERPAEVIAELHKAPLELLGDEWVLAPDLAPVLVRRLSVRLDAQPLAAGLLELVVDGSVLGRRPQPARAPGTIVQLAAGEDQRVFVAATKHWDEDPNRPVNRKREGDEYRLRNLSGDSVRFACYLTRPVSAAKGVTVTVDAATTALWQEPQAGILRWELVLKAGEELRLQRGWVVEAEGKIKL